MSDEPKQSSHWTGEEKLRVVLEAMKTSVVQVCAKYAKHGLSEEQVQQWRQHFIERGGEIFGPNPNPATTQVRVRTRGRKHNPLLIFVATFSILLNAGVVALFAAAHFKLLDLSPWVGSLLQKEVAPQPPGRPSLESLGAGEPPFRAGSQAGGPMAKPDDDPGNPSSTKPSRIPVTAPLFGGPPIVQGPGIVSDVEVCGVRGRGNRVVFVLDLNEYMRTASNGQTKFERLRKEVRDAILSLGQKTAFNVILFNGISHMHLFENKLVYASDSKKREAYAWLSFPVWDVPKGVEARFAETDLLLKPPEGVVGPWLALSAALSFDPDLIYLLTGDCSSLRPDDFSAYELSGVKVSYEVRTPAWERWRRETDATRLTIGKWLQSDNARVLALEVVDAEVDGVIRQLGITMPVKPLGSPDSRWPWKDMYTKFTRGLTRRIPELASTHIVVSLPKGREWPIDLEGSSREFSQLSGGSFTILEDIFFSSP
ncbi:MAG: helix-turn-helix domain-containing protein [Opitutales bacterium]